MIKIREAVYDDMPKITDLLSQVMTVHQNGRPDLFKANTRMYTDEELKKILDDPHFPVFVAADEEGKVSGIAICGFEQHKNDNILTDIRTLYIYALCVDKKCRRRHIGTALCDYILDFAKEDGCYNVTINAWSCNPEAMKFYEACGMVPYAVGMEKIL